MAITKGSEREKQRRLELSAQVHKMVDILGDIILNSLDTLKERDLKKEIHIDIKGEKVSLQAHDEKSIAYMEWLIGLDNFKEVIADAITAIRKRQEIERNE